MPDDKDFDAGFEKPKANMWKPGKHGNVLKGVYVGSKAFTGKYGETESHEFKALAGRYNNIKEDETVDENVTEIVPGEHYVVMDRTTIHDDIKKAVVGQQVIIRYVEDRKPKAGGKPYKYVECKLGGMDPDYGAKKATGEDVGF